METAWDPAVGSMCQTCRDAASAAITAQVKLVGARCASILASEFFIDNLLVRIHLIIAMIVGDRLCAMVI